MERRFIPSARMMGQTHWVGLIDERAPDHTRQKVCNLRYGGCWVLRYGRAFISDRYDRPIAFEAVEEAIDAVEEEFIRIG